MVCTASDMSCAKAVHAELLIRALRLRWCSYVHPFSA